MEYQKAEANMADPDPIAFSPGELEWLRRESSVAEMIYHEVLPSTNDLALELAGHESLKTPLLVLCDRQIAGRGRRDNRWWSAPGALTFSLILNADRLGFTGKRIPPVSLIAAISVAETLGAHLPDHKFGLKWPNDVTISGRKIAGILVETMVYFERRTIIGIGINANNSLRDAPEELRGSATSLIDIAGEPFDRARLLATTLNQLMRNMKETAAGQLEIVDLWQKWCVLTGKHVRARSQTESVEGICRGIQADGELLLATPKGIRSLASATVEWVSPHGNARHDSNAPTESRASGVVDFT